MLRLPEQTRPYRSRIYERYASGFQQAASRFRPEAAARWGKAYAHYLRGYLPERRDARIADLACGGGNLLYFFKQRGYTNLAGVDISPEQVRLARQVVADVVEGSVLDFLAARPCLFDLMTGLDIVEHLEKDEVMRFLDGCYAALKPGGRLVLQTPNAEGPWGSSIRYSDFTHEVCFAPHCLSRLLHLSGFRGVEIREQGPVPSGYSLLSSARYVLWRAIRWGLMLYNLAETGSAGSGVFTRVFLITGRKK